MIRYIFSVFCPVKVWQDTVDINTLPYCRIPLQSELVPQFCLSCQYERHGTHGIEPVIQEKTELLDRFLFQEMCFVQNADNFLFLYTPDDLHFFLELAFCIPL